MMHVYKYGIRSFLTLRYFFHWFSRTGCFGPNQATHISPVPGETSPLTLKAGLFRHHVKQFHEASCSVASVVSVVNTILEKTKGTGGKIITQKAILEKVRTAHWKERMGPDGYKGRRGLPLDVLGQVVRASLDAYGLENARVEIVPAQGGKATQKVKQRLISHLIKFETLDNCLLIAHFDQGSYIKELNIPHISPVGGFDPATGQVTILDVDPSQTLPYQISFDTFYKGISTRYGRVFTPFGYGRGGCILVWIS